MNFTLKHEAEAILIGMCLSTNFYKIIQNANSGAKMITEDERAKRKKNYETAKRNSEQRGIELTPETEALMAKYIDGDISDQEFFVGISKIVFGSTNYH